MCVRCVENEALEMATGEKMAQMWRTSGIGVEGPQVCVWKVGKRNIMQVCVCVRCVQKCCGNDNGRRSVVTDVELV